MLLPPHGLLFRGRITGESVVPLSKGISKGMIPKECNEATELDFPAAEVNRHSAREKSIMHGDPSTPHLWWAKTGRWQCASGGRIHRRDL